MNDKPFPHDIRCYYVADEQFEMVYYARDGKKYKRVREMGLQAWEDTFEIEVDEDIFWMVVACLERRNHHAAFQKR